MDTRVIEQILDKYGLAWSTILESTKGYRNESYPIALSNGVMINLMLHKVEPGSQSLITMADAVSDYVARRGLPTRQMFDRRIIMLRTSNKSQYGAIYNYLDGATIPWEAYTQEHIKLLGESLSNLHAQLKDLADAKELPHVSNQYFVKSEEMEIYFSDIGVQQAMMQKLGLRLTPAIFKRYYKLLKLCSRLPEQQALHMDFVRGNILFKGSKETLHISGILDFEKTAYGPSVFDIARTLAFLLVDCKYKKEDKIRKYFLGSGYNKRGHSNFTEVSLLEELVNLFLVYDFYKFLRHNPYEFLAENEHFVRTKQLLLSRHIVDRIDSKIKKEGF